MSIFKGLFSRGGKFKPPDENFLSKNKGYVPPSQDTLSAIGALSEVVKNNPDAVEIYLALGNLYRGQGEIERAVQIRHNLIVRPNLDDRFRARAWFELGRDYKRGGFLDRALNAFEKAKELAGDNPSILMELARLSAESGYCEKAAELYSKLSMPVAQAHYLVRLAREARLGNGDTAGKKWLDKALKVYPGSPEAWMEKMIRNFTDSDWNKLSENMGKAMKVVSADMRFTILEGLIRHAESRAYPAPGPDDGIRWAPGFPVEEFCGALMPVLEEHEQDVLLLYYTAYILKKCADMDQAKRFLEKALLLNSDFWAARLELLEISLNASEELPPVLRLQVEFFIERAKQVKRFNCRRCGIMRESTFFVCPRCQSWHSIAFRMALTE